MKNTPGGIKCDFTRSVDVYASTAYSWRVYIYSSGIEDVVCPSLDEECRRTRAWEGAVFRARAVKVAP